jgi:hypothetical protein
MADRRKTWEFVGSLLLLASCRARPPETRIIVVTATPAPVAIASATAEETPTPEIQMAEFSVPVMEPTEPPSLATITPFPASAFEPRQEPTPASLHEEMQRCLKFSAENESIGGALEGAARVKVTIKNQCNVDFSWNDVWVEVRAMRVGVQGTVAREVTRLYGGIRAFGEAEAMVVVVGPSNGPFFHYEASLWWAAGGGREAHR